MKQKNPGFTLLELIVGMAIIAIGLSAALPSYLRNIRQGEIDRYTQQLEAGFFGLRAKLGQQKTSCTLKFDKSGINNFVTPAELVEMNKHPERIECCNSDIEAAGIPNGCAYGPKIGNLLAKQSEPNNKDKIIRDRSLRLLDREGTPESKKVEISVNLESYELTPPGTSTSGTNSLSDEFGSPQDLIFLIRSKASEEKRLRTRCIQVSGIGSIFRASWNYESLKCIR